MGVADTWATVKTESAKHGLEYFIQFFADYPHYQEYYPQLKGKSGCTLRSDPAMRCQADAVMAAIDKFVAAGGDKEALEGPLGELAKSHVPRGVKSAYFKDGFDSFVVYLEKSGVSTDGWPAAVDTIMEVLIREVEKRGGS